MSEKNKIKIHSEDILVTGEEDEGELTKKVDFMVNKLKEWGVDTDDIVFSGYLDSPLLSGMVEEYVPSFKDYDDEIVAEMARSVIDGNVHDYSDIYESGTDFGHAFYAVDSEYFKQLIEDNGGDSPVHPFGHAAVDPFEKGVIAAYSKKRLKELGFRFDEEFIFEVEDLPLEASTAKELAEKAKVAEFTIPASY